MHSGVSVSRLARQVDVHGRDIAEAITATAGIDPEIQLRLDAGFGDFVT
jgi:plasmid maintenance system antidote protein VapI